MNRKTCPIGKTEPVALARARGQADMFSVCSAESLAYATGSVEFPSPPDTGIVYPLTRRKLLCQMGCFPGGKKAINGL